MNFIWQFYRLSQKGGVERAQSGVCFHPGTAGDQKAKVVLEKTTRQAVSRSAPCGTHQTHVALEGCEKLWLGLSYDPV